jgi:hypothetical protein
MLRAITAVAAVLFAPTAYAADCKAISNSSARLTCFDKSEYPAPAMKTSVGKTSGGPEPAAVKQAILATRYRLFFDPDSLRDASIGNTFTCLTGKDTCVCIEVNGKNPDGGYSGLQLLGVKILSGGQTAMIGEMAQSAGGTPCGVLSPFPQLNGRQ